MYFTNDEGWVKANGKKDSTENRLHTVIILSNKTTTNTDKNPFFSKILFDFSSISEET